MAVMFRLLVGGIAVATLLPLLPVGAWWVRLCDFPRLQIGSLVLIPLLGIAFWIRRHGWAIEPGVLLAACLALAAWQFSHFLPYTPLWKLELADSRETDAINTVTVVNLKFENDNKSKVLQQLTDLGSDVLLLIEFDQAWNAGLAPLRASYPHRQGVILEEGLGMMLWSKLPLLVSEVKYLVSEKRPSVFAQLDMSNGRVVHFVGVHPTPPGLWSEQDGERFDSRIRDAELLVIADTVAENPDRDWLIAGDFNDVAWSHTTRMFQRISGLKDPRVGRGLYNTYHAGYPIMRFPIDQVFLSPSARVTQLERFRPAGSDHFAIKTTFALESQEPLNPQPKGNDLEQAEEMIDEGLDDAAESDNRSTSE